MDFGLSFKDYNDLKTKIYSGNLIDTTRFLNYLVIYPFIGSIHIVHKYSNDDRPNFKMEYVLPSYCMNWLFNKVISGDFYNGLDGMIYSSTRCDDTTALNYAFPAKYRKDMEFCEDLMRIFLSDGYYENLYSDQLYTSFKSRHLGSRIIELNDIELDEIKSLFKI